jgi:hypothetical protein
MAALRKVPDGSGCIDSAFMDVLLREVDGGLEVPFPGPG